MALTAPIEPTTQERRDVCASYFKDLQERITARFEQLDGHGAFDIKPWEKTPEDKLQGHGEMRVMRSEVFEKVGVNFSNVHGTFDEKFRAQIPGAEQSDGKFWASGVSLVAHMKNPMVPTVHMNVRRIETSWGWFGGGADLTPFFPFDEDTAYFHTCLKEACDGYQPDAYDKFKKWCDEYFHLHHRDEPRGVGGTFFDNLNSGDFDKDFAFVQATGEAFLKAFSEIVERRKDMDYTTDDKEHQLIRRGRYVEFNLLYDRGTKFGFESGGDPEAILMSMPPEVKWP